MPKFKEKLYESSAITPNMGIWAIKTETAANLRDVQLETGRCRIQPERPNVMRGDTTLAILKAIMEKTNPEIRK